MHHSHLLLNSDGAFGAGVAAMQQQADEQRAIASAWLESYLQRRLHLCAFGQGDGGSVESERAPLILDKGRW